MHRKKSLFLLILCMLLLVPVSAFASTSKSSSAASSTTGTIKSIYFSKYSYAKLSNVQLLNTNGQNILSYSLTIHNGDKSALNYYDYFMQLKSKAGTQFPVSLIKSSNFQQTIEPNSSVTYQYYAKVDNSIKLSDLNFEWIKWDFSVSGYQKKVGSFGIPSNYDLAVPEKSALTLNPSNIKLSAKVSQYSETSNTSYTFPSITVDLKNMENGSVQTPTMNYYIKTESGALYPLDVKLSNQNAIKPLDTEQVYLSGSIPKQVTTKDSELVITNNVSTGSGTDVELPLGSVKLKNSITTSTTTNSFIYTNNNGTYQIKLNAVHRTPWEDQDELIADIEVTNNSSNTIPALNLGGNFILFNNTQIQSNTILLDKIIAIQPKQTVHYRMICKIPYTYDFPKINIQLKDMDNNTDIVQLTKAGTLDTIPNVSSVKYDQVGQQFSINPQSVETYQGDSSKIFATQLDVTNLEKRYTNIPSLSVHFVDNNGIVYPAQLEMVSDKLLPGGDALVQAWTTLPETTDTSKLKLVVGEGITGTSYTPNGGTPDAYVNAVKLSLPSEKDALTNSLTNLKIGSYNLNINNILWQSMNYNNAISGWNVSIKFDYSLSQDLLQEANISQHHYLIALEDSNGNKLQTSEMTINNNQAVGGNNLKPGSSSYQISAQIEVPLINQSKYKLAVYDEFQSGYLKLLGSRNL